MSRHLFPFDCLSSDTLLGYGGVSTVHKISKDIVLKTTTLYSRAEDPKQSWHQVNARNQEAISDERNWYLLLDKHPHPNRLQSFISVKEGIFLPRMQTSLKDRLASLDHDLVSLKAKYLWAKEVAAAVASLGELELSHNDIRAANFLLDDQGHIKLADFDNVSFYDAPPPIGTAPDWVWYSNQGGPKHDIFGVGNVLWELFTGAEYDWGDPDHPHFIPDTTDVEHGEIISKCWNRQYESVTELKRETEARYLRLLYGAFASCLLYLPSCFRPGADGARVLSKAELDAGRAAVEKFLSDQAALSRKYSAGWHEW